MLCASLFHGCSVNLSARSGKTSPPAGGKIPRVPLPGACFVL